MARYKAKTRTFVNDTLVEAGQEFDSDKEPGESWAPVDDDARAAVAAAEQRRATKASAVAAGVVTTGNEELVALVKDLIDKQAADSARISKLEAAGIPDVSGFVRDTELATLSTIVDRLVTDTSELDAGLQLIDGRLSDVEGVQEALAKAGAKPRTPPPPPPEPEPEPVVEAEVVTETPPADTPVEAPPTE